ncbi:phosphatidylinositol-3,5-bisphosphate 3-phosphatase MTMR3 isoform X1 [Paramisgurnus dabryanus]|uniref:phosphatidylinositol-3,5-bisphosphate 3-phosphatase MTMR3 isoform X1 n=1 Tax=Paramisgurnus dabryanus TaxID=90735 RepID=UPI0031F38649
MVEEEEQSVKVNGSPDPQHQQLQVLFPLLYGERVEYVGRAERSVITLTSYRLHIELQDNIINVPLQLIESVDCRDMTQLHLTCKDGKVIRCHFMSVEQCQDWLRRISAVARPPGRLKELFAFTFVLCSTNSSAEEKVLHDGICRAGGHEQRFKSEMERMGFHTHSAWRISNINNNYRLCASYPEQILVPAAVTDQQLENVAAFRSWKRIPAVVYRHRSSGAVIGRCGQPEVSWWGWRNADDERLIQSIAKACAADPPTSNGSCIHDSDPHTANRNTELALNATPPQKLLIMDARSYAAAVANRAKGGGCECPEYYPSCEVMFMGMANIHSIRRSFQSLRTVCAQVPDPVNWLSALEGTKWLQHLSLLLKASLLVVNAVDRDHRAVLVHCSDGWDRTPQIVALSKLLLDPFYRTIQGFQVLVEMEWLDFGHKFADRCGHGEKADDVNERCPVFLQWLDCVHQLLRQFPCSFEFNEAFLVKLVQHTYSCLFGTFLCNSLKEREEQQVQEKTCSVWSLLRPTNPAFLNILYSPRSETVLHPVCHVRNLMLWSAIYLPNSAPSTPSDESCMPHSAPVSPEDTPVSRLPKTRSCDDLPAATQNHRSSDPNLNEMLQDHLTITTESNSSQCSTDDSHSTSEMTLDHRIDCMKMPGDRTKGAELCVENGVTDSQSEHVLQEDNMNLEFRINTSALSSPEDSASSDGSNASAEDQTSEHTDDPTYQPTSQMLLAAPDDLAVDNDVPLTNTPSHEPSTEEPHCPNSTLQSPDDVICGDHQYNSTDVQTATGGDASLTLPHKCSWGFSEQEPAVTQRLTTSGDEDKDELRLHNDVVQVRQMDAERRLQVDALKKLWSRLHVNGKLTSLPDGENNFDPGCLPRCGTELLSESNWEQIEQQDPEVRQWYADHPASRCYGCKRTFWLAARTQHCSGREAVEEDWNCGNVFCASCCDQKVAVQSQQLCESKHVCQVCYGHLRPSPVPPALPPADLELENPIAASSN